VVIGDEFLPDVPVNGLNVDQWPHALEAIQAHPHIALLIIYGITGYLSNLPGKIADYSPVLCRHSHDIHFHFMVLPFLRAALTQQLIIYYIL
jgi:hypothetical protein